jgi:hypothetical protein
MYTYITAAAKFDTSNAKNLILEHQWNGMMESGIK